MPLHFESISEIAQRLRQADLTSSALTGVMLNRIEKHNPTLNAFITVTSELALEQAAKADSELSKGMDRGLLHGVPVALKDLIATKGILTTCGSKIYAQNVPDFDATVVKLLNDAGAVTLGKTGLHELAYGGTSINPFYGAIGNPWDPSYDPGGSSGGSAAAVAAGLAFAAIGTDTGCSIRQPAHCCGIVGHKPTFGMVSRSGIYPLLWSMDHVGPMARTVDDTAVLLSAIAGHDPADPYSTASDFTHCALSPRQSVAGLKIGVVKRFFFDGRQDVLDIIDTALAKLADQGALIIDMDIPEIERAHQAARLMFVEGLAVHAEHLQTTPELFSDEVRKKLEDSKEISAAEFAAAQDFKRHFSDRMDKLLTQVDVLAAPTATCTSAPIDNRPDDYGVNAWKNTGIFDLTGQPSVSLPAGLASNGMPVGLMLSSQRFDDRKLIETAYAVEQALEKIGTPSLF